MTEHPFTALGLTNLAPRLDIDSDANGTPDGLIIQNYYTPSLDALHGDQSVRITGNGATLYRLRLAGTSQPNYDPTHIYYACIWGKTTRAATNLTFVTGDRELSTILPGSGEWEFTSTYVRAQASGGLETQVLVWQRSSPAWTSEDVVLLDSWGIADLTAHYGAGNEPTVDEMDALLAGDPLVARSTVRAASFNTKAVQAQYTHRLRQAGQIIKRLRPDIAGIQEAWNNVAMPEFSFSQAFDLGGGAAFQVDVPFFTDWEKGRGITSAHPLTETSWSATPSQGVLRSIVTFGGQRAAVYSIHNPYSSSGATAEGYMSLLWSLVSADSEPNVIVCGDMNYPAAAQGGSTNGYDVFIANGWTTAQHHLGWVSTTQPEDSAFNPLDNVVVSPALTIVDAGIEETYSSSDHRLIWADITVPGYQPINRRRGAIAAI